MWYIQDYATGKFLTMRWNKISFTDNMELAYCFDTEEEAIQFEDNNGHSFEELTTPVFIA